MANNPLDKKEIEELRRLLKQMGQEMSALEFDNLIKSGAAARTLLNSLRKEIEELTSDISYAAEGFRKIVEEIRNTNEGVKLATKSFNKLSSIADKIKYHQLDISRLSLKEVQTLQEQVRQEKSRLSTANGMLESKIKDLNLTIAQQKLDFDRLLFKDQKTKAERQLLQEIKKNLEKNNKELSKTEAAQRNIQGILRDEDILFKGLTTTLNGINNELEKEKKTLGLTGALLTGMSKIPILGNIADTDQALNAAKEYVKEAGDAATKTGAMKAAFKNIGSQIKTSLTDPLIIVGFLVTQIVDTFKSVDSSVGDMAKGLDLSYGDAARLRMELTDIANFSGDVAVNTKGLQESLMAVSQTLGVNASLNKEDLITFTKLREQAGYTNDELMGFQKLATINNKSVGDTSKAFLGTVARLNAQNKSAINAKQLFKEMASVSDAIKLSVGGTAEKLAEAAYKAKAFGVTLQQADQISESLLNFEQSLANELSAELITGKDLNFEKARLLAINGDIAGASEEILKQIKGSAEFTKMNRIQQEAIAKAVGMSREDLAKSLVDREVAARLGAKEGQAAQDKYNELVKSYGVEKANDMLGDKALERQFQQQSIQDRFNQTIEKLKEIFVSLVEPLLPVLDIFAEIFKIIGPIAGLIGTVVKYAIDWGKYLLIPYGILKGMQFVTKGITALNTLLIRQNATKIAQNQAQVVSEGTKLGLGQRILATLGLQTAQGFYQEAIAAGLGKKVALRMAMEETILGKLILQGFNLGKNLIKYIGLALQAGYRAIIENTILGSIIAQGVGILKNIGTLGAQLLVQLGIMSASMATNAALTFGIGVAVAVGAALAGIAAIKAVTADDMVSAPPGYGKRTLIGPEGAVALNDKDTVIAGTNLGGGKEKSSTVVQQQDLSPLLNEMKAMRQEQAKSNSKPTVIENSVNGTKYGTAVAMNTYRIQ